jgi:hypothetical protein
MAHTNTDFGNPGLNHRVGSSTEIAAGTVGGRVQGSDAIGATLTDAAAIGRLDRDTPSQIRDSGALDREASPCCCGCGSGDPAAAGSLP